MKEKTIFLRNEGSIVVDEKKTKKKTKNNARTFEKVPPCAKTIY